MEIESDKVKYVIGRGGTKIRDIQYSCRVSVQIGTVFCFIYTYKLFCLEHTTTIKMINLV